MDAVERLAELLLAKVRARAGFSTVLAPAMGGLVIGQEVARQAKARYIFCEKENNVLVMRRGFTLAPGEPSSSSRTSSPAAAASTSALEIVRKAGGAVAGVAMLVDRSAATVRFDAPSVSLLELSFPTYPADRCPRTWPGSRLRSPGAEPGGREPQRFVTTTVLLVALVVDQEQVAARVQERLRGRDVLDRGPVDLDDHRPEGKVLRIVRLLVHLGDDQARDAGRY
jgi:orotate phosphoribosyltransferase